LADINFATVQETIDMIKKEGLKTELLALEANITDLDSVKEMVSKTVQNFGSLDYGK
jgi:NAD(P)-dependent dehydrogenase (short-subunit alcohol dehydrogenase family)